MNPKYLNIYAKEYEHKSKEELERFHQSAWLNGYHVYVAAVSILNKEHYPKYISPFQTESNEIGEKQDTDDNEAKKMAAGFAAFIANNKAFKNLPKSNE